MPGGAEGDLLRGYARVGMLDVVRGDEVGYVDEVAGRGGLAGTGMDRHGWASSRGGAGVAARRSQAATPHVPTFGHREPARPGVRMTNVWGMAGRFPIEDVAPSLACGRYPAKAVVGEVVPVSARAYREGHAALGVNVALRG